MTNNQQLAVITAEERAALIADCKSDIDFFTWEINKFAAKKLPPSVMARMQSQLKRQQMALAALTQPASPAFQLPDEMVIDGRHLNDDSIHNVFKRGEKSGFNRCLREVLKLNAPHTVQIEPICATGGAEWVKCSDRMPVIGENCWRTPLPVLVMCELGIIPAYARTYTTLSGEKKVGFAASLVFGNNDGDQPESLYSSEILTQATMWREMPAAPIP